MDLHAGGGKIVALVSFSLAIMARVEVPVVERNQGRLTLMRVSGAMMRSKIIIIVSPTARLLASLQHGCHPILGVPMHLRRGDVVVVLCWCSVSLNLI
jgi:hypothetical protein